MLEAVTKMLPPKVEVLVGDAEFQAACDDVTVRNVWLCQAAEAYGPASHCAALVSHAG